MLNRTRTIILETKLKLYSSLQFKETGLIFVKAGETVTLEETGKIYESDGKQFDVLRLRKNTRNYYVIIEL